MSDRGTLGKNGRVVDTLFTEVLHPTINPGLHIKIFTCNQPIVELPVDVFEVDIRLIYDPDLPSNTCPHYASLSLLASLSLFIK